MRMSLFVTPSRCNCSTDHNKILHARGQWYRKEHRIPIITKKSIISKKEMLTRNRKITCRITKSTIIRAKPQETPSLI